MSDSHSVPHISGLELWAILVISSDSRLLLLSLILIEYPILLSLYQTMLNLVNDNSIVPVPIKITELFTYGSVLLPRISNIFLLCLESKCHFPVLCLRSI